MDALSLQRLQPAGGEDRAGAAGEDRLGQQQRGRGCFIQQQLCFQAPFKFLQSSEVFQQD